MTNISQALAKALIPLSALLPFHFCCAATAAHSAPAPAQTFSNPVIYADVPDPDVIRVGDNFYMVSTTMHFSPGCPIMRSTDLVNWEVIGYAHDQLEELDGFALKNGQNDYSRGSWAANLRYDRHEGRFYLIVTCNTTSKSYIFTTTDINHGPWHRNEVEMCYDPGLLFDDNGCECRKYVIHPDFDLGVFTCHIRELISDGNGGVTLGPKSLLIDYTQMEKPSEGLRAEGYHAYHIGDYYYIFMIQGQGWQRQETVWRSRELKPGTFEPRKIFTGNIVNPDGSDYIPSSGVAQGGIVDTPDGSWYAMLFQDNGAVGRIPVLIPMTWDAEGWPRLGNDGKSVDRYLPVPIAGARAVSRWPTMSLTTVRSAISYPTANQTVTNMPGTAPTCAPNGSGTTTPTTDTGHSPPGRATCAFRQALQPHQSATRATL